MPNEIDYGNCERCGENFLCATDRYTHRNYSNYVCTNCVDYLDQFDDNTANELDIPERSYESIKLTNKLKRNRLTNIIQSDRGFGVEIELYNRSMKNINLLCKDIDSEIGVSKDGSLNNNGFELQFPLINGKNAEIMVNKTCNILADYDCFTDQTCGYHLHLECERGEKSFPFIQRLMFISYIFENVINSFISKTRRENRFCDKIENYISIDNILDSENKSDLEQIWYKTSNKRNIRARKRGKYDESRYHGFNFHCYFSKDHLEVRHHSGTINKEKILHWANLHTLLLDFVKREVELSSDINKWGLKDKLLSLYDDGFANDKLYENTLYMFDLIGLSSESRDYFIKRQNNFKSILCVE